MLPEKSRLKWTHDAVTEAALGYRIKFDTDPEGDFDHYYEIPPNLKSAAQSMPIYTPMEDTYFIIFAFNEAGEGALSDPFLFDKFSSTPSAPTDITFEFALDETEEPPPILTVSVPEPPSEPIDFIQQMLLSPYAKVIDTTSPSGAAGELPAKNAINGKSGDDNDRWSLPTLATGTTFVEIDFGKNVEVSGIILDTYQNRAYQFKVEAKPEGGSYSVIADLQENTSAGPIKHSLGTPAIARFYKLTITGCAVYAAPWVSIREWDIYGPEVDGLSPQITEEVSNFEHPGGVNTLAQMTLAATRINTNMSPWLGYYNKLLGDANLRLSEPPSAVETWSCPDSVQEPAAFAKVKYLYQNDAWAAGSCALIYAINALRAGQVPSSDKYADKAKQILMNWATVNKKITVDSQTTLTACVISPAMLLAAECIMNYPAWSATEKNTFKAWASGPLNAAAEFKKLRSLQRNLDGSFSVPVWIKIPYYANHNCWALLTSLCIAHLTEDIDLMNDNVRLAKALIHFLIRPDGGMPSELERSEKSINYTAYALEPLTAAVELIRNSGGENLYHWTAPSGGSIKPALTFLFDKGIENPNLWPIPKAKDQPAAVTEASSLELFAAMGRVYNIQKWRDYGQPPIPDFETGVGHYLPTLFEASPI